MPLGGYRMEISFAKQDVGHALYFNVASILWLKQDFVAYLHRTHRRTHSNDGRPDEPSSHLRSRGYHDATRRRALTTIATFAHQDTIMEQRDGK